MDRRPWTASPLDGTFSTTENGLRFTLMLELDSDGLLSGQLQFGELVFDIRGSLSRRANVAYGFVLEPHSALPLALLRASVSGEEMTLELDIPDPGDLESLGDPVRLALARLGARRLRRGSCIRA